MPQGVLPFQLEVEHEKTRVTVAAGLLPYIELMVAAGVLNSARKHIGIRAPGGQGWTDAQFLLATTLLNIQGGEAVSDLDVLEADTGLGAMVRAAELTGLTGRKRREFKRRFRGARSRTIPSASSLFRFLESFHDNAWEAQRVEGRAFIQPSTEALRGLYQVNADFIRFVQRSAPRSVATLDQDATLVATDKREAKFCYKGFRAYQPLNVYWFEHDVVLHSEFRDGNVPAGFQQLRVLREAIAQLPNSVEKVQLRSDSAGYQAELLRYCAEGQDERFGVIDFAISSKVTADFKRAVAELGADDWHPLLRQKNGEQHETGQEWAEVCFVPNTLSTVKDGPSYRFLAIREPLKQLDLPGVDEKRDLPFPTMEAGDGTRFKVFGLVTNMDLPGDELIWWHRERCGRSEAVHAVMKHDLAGGRMPSGKFGVNAAWWALMVLAHNVAAAMKSLVLGGEWARKRMKAVRFGFINVAARLIDHAGRTILRIGRRHPAFELIREARRRIVQLAQPPPPRI